MLNAAYLGVRCANKKMIAGEAVPAKKAAVRRDGFVVRQ